ncbi:hypothetical protein Rain11_2132 [Raineya orbicola]|jgi:hypothetical protein|uniref:Uncharacterized protein n=1 Tax=Raineya orbicola TaxID=2016530 RepID=A0A2N3IA98_9BACT|nr:hypothetical protein Rain11_2132 [Raineya orbicola]
MVVLGKMLLNTRNKMVYLKKYKLYILGAVLGALAGWAYWYYVGCHSGTCAITSKPLNSSLYGLVMGMLFLGIFDKSDSRK